MKPIKEDIGLLFLRIGLGGVFFIFAIDKFLDPARAIGWIPEWLPSMLPMSPESFILVLSAFEFIIGFLLLIGFGTKIAARLGAALFLSIIISWGFNEVMLRDAGLFFLALGIALVGPGNLSLDKLRKGG